MILNIQNASILSKNDFPFELILLTAPINVHIESLVSHSGRGLEKPATDYSSKMAWKGALWYSPCMLQQAGSFQSDLRYNLYANS